MKVAPCLLAISVAVASHAHAGTIAACGPQKGYAYYPAAGLVPKGKDGWTEDQISAGSTTLTQNEKGEYDILFRDARGEIISARNDGGEVIPLRRSSTEITVLTAYPNGDRAAEIYSFVREVDGRAKMLMLSSKGTTMMPKAGVYIASCANLNLSD
jgi:hypothetical protein